MTKDQALTKALDLLTHEEIDLRGLEPLQVIKIAKMFADILVQVHQDAYINGREE